MTRLIDADALKKHLHKDPLYPLVEKYGMDGVIDAQPTIDAVPIEFIQKRIDQLKEMNGLIFEYESWELERLVRKWREENATAD